jgi:hypothetical protein
MILGKSRDYASSINGSRLAINQIPFLPIRNKKLQNGEMPKLLKDKKYLIVDDI